MTLAPSQSVDRYEVLRQIGEGGLSVVYLVRHNVLGTSHALKVLRVGAPEVRERLLREGRAQAALNHPNVVTVRDVMQIGDTAGLLMDYVDGGSLESHLLTRPLSLAEIDALGRGVIMGVRAAHSAGLVHRDLKPGNVLLTKTGVPKVTDFGLVRVLSPESQAPVPPSATRSRMLMGTPAYMSPEQIENARHADQRSDIFSLGALLYELATGRRAFDGERVVDILYAISRGHRVGVRELRPDLPLRIAEAIDGALEPHRPRRVGSADQLLRIWCEGATAVSVVTPAQSPRDNRPITATPVPHALVRTPPPPPKAPEADGPEVSLPFAAAPPIGGTLVPQARVAGPPQSALDRARPAPLEGPTAPIWMPVLLGALCALGVLAMLLPWVPAPGFESAEAATPISRSAPEGPPMNWDYAESAVPGAEPGPEGTADPEGPALLPRASVVVQGGVEHARLRRRVDGRVVAPGDWVPPGLYDLVAQFPDGTVLTVSVGLMAESGGSYTVTCDVDFYTCSVAES